MKRPPRRNLDAEEANRIDVDELSPQRLVIELRALRSGEYRTFTDRPGLRLVCAGRTRTFLYRYRSPLGGLRQIKLGRWPVMSWGEVEDAWKKLVQARDAGRDPRLERQAAREAAKAEHAAKQAARKRGAVTVERVVRKYLTEHVNRTKDPLAEKSRYDALRMFEGRVLPKLGAEPAVAIDRAEAADFLASVKLEAPALARLLRSRLGAAWDHAIERRLLPSDQVNPWRDALRGKLAARSRSRFLADAELATLLKALPGLPALLAKRRMADGEDIRDALLLALYTAARSGEVVGMDWAAVELKRGTWTLQTTKTDEPRTVRLPRQVVEILRRRGRAFEGLQQQRLSLGLREAKHLGVKAFTPHDLRRSARTGLSRIGVRDEIAEAALGHVQGGIRGTYNLHAYEAEVGEALQKWADHLDALQAPEVKPLRRHA